MADLTRVRMDVPGSRRFDAVWLFPPTYVIHLGEESLAAGGFPLWAERTLAIRFSNAEFTAWSTLALGLMCLGGWLVSRDPKFRFIEIALGRRRAGQCRRARVRQHPHVDVLARSGQRRSHLDSAGGLAPSKSTACLDAARLYCRRVPSTTNGGSRAPMRAFGERCVHCGQRAVVVDGHGVGRCARHHHEHTSARETCIRRREAARRAIDVARGAQGGRFQVTPRYSTRKPRSPISFGNGSSQVLFQKH